MRGVFDDKVLESANPRRDTELTLGSGTLLVLFVGLVLLCGLFFGLGYAVGHRSSLSSSAATQPPASGAQAPAMAATAHSKPSATAQTYAAPPPARAAVNLPPSSDANTNSAVSSQPLYPSTGGSTPSQPQVKPALPSQAESPQPAAGPNGSLKVEPAFAPAGQPMVQIAAVSQPEDAEVLVNALRKRGYAVSARREATDSLIHVRIGPFASRDEANQWRQKLLNDGYNAILQP